MNVKLLLLIFLLASCSTPDDPANNMQMNSCQALLLILLP